MTWAFEMRRENGVVIGIERFDYCFNEEECIVVNKKRFMDWR